MSKKFIVTIPEKREEVVNVVYEVEAKNEAELKHLIQEGDFPYLAKYIENSFNISETFIAEKFKCEIQIFLKIILEQIYNFFSIARPYFKFSHKFKFFII